MPATPILSGPFVVERNHMYPGTSDPVRAILANHTIIVGEERTFTTYFDCAHGTMAYLSVLLTIPAGTGEITSAVITNMGGVASTLLLVGSVGSVDQGEVLFEFGETVNSPDGSPMIITHM